MSTHTSTHAHSKSWKCVYTCVKTQTTFWQRTNWQRLRGQENNKNYTMGQSNWWVMKITQCDKRGMKRTCNTLTHGSLSNLILFASEACASATSELPSFPWFSSSGDGLFWPGLLSCDTLLCVSCDDTSQSLDCCESGRCCWLFCRLSCRLNCPLLPRPRILLKQNIFCTRTVKATGVRLKGLKSSGPSESH